MNDVFHSAVDLLVSVGVLTDEIAAAVESLRVEAADVGFFGAEVPVEGVWTPDQQFALRAGRDGSAGVVDDAQFVVDAQWSALGVVDHARRVAGSGVVQ